MAHIRAIPGFGDGWPQRAYSLAENEADLAEHLAHHQARIDFAWTILAPGTSQVIGCLYVKPSSDGPIAKSWLRADHAHLDATLRSHVQAWLDQWPIAVRYLG